MSEPGYGSPSPSESEPSLLHEPPHPVTGPVHGPGHPSGAGPEGEHPAGATAPYPTAGYTSPAPYQQASYQPAPYRPEHYQPANYPTAAYQQTTARPLYSGPLTASERNWATAAHLSGFVAAWFALGFLGPLVVMGTEGGRSPFVRRHAVEALNFNLSVLLWVVISGILVLALVGLLLLPAVGILYLVSTVLAAMAASRGEEFRYPLTIRFVRR